MKKSDLKIKSTASLFSLSTRVTGLLRNKKTIKAFLLSTDYCQNGILFKLKLVDN